MKEALTIEAKVEKVEGDDKETTLSLEYDFDNDYIGILLGYDEVCWVDVDDFELLLSDFLKLLKARRNA